MLFSKCLNFGQGLLGFKTFATKLKNCTIIISYSSSSFIALTPIQVYGFDATTDDTVHLNYTATMLSEGRISSAEYSAGVGWSNRYLLLDILKRNSVTGNIFSIYPSQYFPCIDPNAYGFLGK